jgi:hypothetical protein
MRLGRWLTSALVLALLAGGGYAAFLGLRGTSSGATAQPPLCPLPSTSPAPSHGPKPKVVVDNATLQPGLATQVAAQLKHRGFIITDVGNTPTMGKGVATVRYSADRRLLADRLAAQIQGTTLVAGGGHGVVELDIGPKFRALASRADAKAAYLSSAPSPTAAPSPAASCRPRRSGS